MSDDILEAGQTFMEENKNLMENLAKQEELDKKLEVPPVLTEPVVSHTEPTEKEQQVIPELVFNKLLQTFLNHVTQLSREQAIRTLAHSLAYPLEHERLPKLKGKHSKLAFQSAIRMFDAKLLMFYNYMKQVETSSVETIDEMVKQLLEKKEQLLKETNNEETKTT